MTEAIINVGIAAFGMSGKIFHAPFLNADKRFNLKKVFERTTIKQKKNTHQFKPYVHLKNY